MKYLKQFAIILSVTCIGELCNYFLPLPIPASIYGLILMLVLLVLGILKIDQVDETGTFLVEIMPVMFIPAGVGLITAFDTLRPLLLPILLITTASTFIVMGVTGKVTDLVIARNSETTDGPENNAREVQKKTDETIGREEGKENE